MTVRIENGKIIWEKEYLSFAELAEVLELPKTTVRYWLNTFPECFPGLRGGNTWHRYSLSDLQALQEIQRLIRVEGRTIAGARREMGLE